MKITRRIIFHAGHMLKDDNSKCYHPHGHEYVLECTVRGEVKEQGSESGMIMNFGRLKEIMMTQVHDVLDHRFLIEMDDPRIDLFIKAVGHDAVVIFSAPPTAENLIDWMFMKINGALPSDIIISKLLLKETLNCWAERNE